jgi:prevent-host-death family protein
MVGAKPEAGGSSSSFIRVSRLTADLAGSPPARARRASIMASFSFDLPVGGRTRAPGYDAFARFGAPGQQPDFRRRLPPAFSHYREVALQTPVTITNHGRDSRVLMGTDEYRRLKSRDRVGVMVEDISYEDSEPSPNRTCRLNSPASTTKSRQTSVQFNVAMDLPIEVNMNWTVDVFCHVEDNSSRRIRPRALNRDL